MDEHRGFRPPDDPEDGDEPVIRFGDDDEAGGRSSLFGDIPDLEPGDVSSLFGSEDTPSAPTPTPLRPAESGPAVRFDDDPSGPLPPWTEPATGVVPQVPAAEPAQPADPLDAWASLHDEPPVWEDAGSTRRTDEPVRIGAAEPLPEPAPAPEWGDEGPAVADGAGRNLPMALATGVAFALVVLAILQVGPPGAMVALVSVVAVLAVAELLTAVRRVGVHPAHLLGLAATGAFPAAVYWRGANAYAVLIPILVIATFLWFVSELDSSPLLGWSTTIGAVLWVGGLASFASLLLRFDDGKGAFLCAIVGTVAHDTGAYAVGRLFGSSRLASTWSPNKTYEGLVGGIVIAVVAVGLLGVVGGGMAPLDGLLDGLLVGVAVAVAAALGDLSQSMIKRDLGLKDMGTVMPGHGGFLDRFDGTLFAFPAAWAVFTVLGIS